MLLYIYIYMGNIYIYIYISLGKKKKKKGFSATHSEIVSKAEILLMRTFGAY